MAQRADMSNRRLTPEELIKANNALDLVRSRIGELSGGDSSLRFAYNGKIAKELVYDERGKPVVRIRLKARERKEQGGKCALDPTHELPAKGAS